MVASRWRWLVEGRSLRAKTAAVLLLLLLFSSSLLFAFAGGAANAAGGEGEEPDAAKLSTVGVDRSNNTTGAGAFAAAAAGGGVGVGAEAPKPHPLPSAVLPPRWYSAWATLLQAQLDGLFALVEQRDSPGPDNTLHTAGLGADGPQRRGLVDDGLGFKILLVGDSTVRAQANMLSWILSQRKANDGRKQCFKSSVKEESGWADVFCTRADGGVDAGEGSPEGVHIFLTVHYVKTYDGCVSEEVDADFVYFGCGLHFLQLIPNRTEEGQRLDAWVHYERLLEEAVLFYRSGGGKAGNRVPVGEAFMTTHSFTVERLEGAYMTRVGEYAEGKESVLSRCRAVTNSLEPIHGDWPNEYEPEEICTRGIFDDNGVVDLNRRAEGVMDRLGVPTVKAYDITKGQAWATQLRDGRHYAGLVPLEVNSMLSEITTALRRERRAATA